MLKEILQALCSQGRWSYAVFWRLQRRNRMVLTWEEGFYGPNVAPVGLGQQNTGAQGTRMIDVDAGQEFLRVAVAKMCCQVYYLGEGIIGRVAITGKHQWVFGGDKGVSTGMDKYPVGWDSQFTAGIKTIAVIAVAQGVVQLGSVETVLEDLDMVAHVRSVFLKLQDSPGGIISNDDAERPVAVPILGPPFGPSWMLNRSSKSSGLVAENALLAEAVPGGPGQTEVKEVSLVSSAEVDSFSRSKCSGVELSFIKNAFLPPMVDHLSEVGGKPLWKNHEPGGGTPAPQPHTAAGRDVNPDSASKKLRSIHTDQELLEHEVDKYAQALDNDEGTTRTCRKRTRLGENVRPRPKDRQQIQDRVRELREIVPESSKCSIDSLLERTVRHIHFLSNLTQLKGSNIAGKLKDRAIEENVSHNSSGTDFNPLIVEDLSYPHHMLVEVVMEKKSLLGEVAENIRGLGLNIVKGVMEVKSEKILACFVVETAQKRCSGMEYGDGRIHASGAW